MVNRTKKEFTEHGMGMYRYRRCRCEICCAAMREERGRYGAKSDNSKLQLDATPLLEFLEKKEYTSLYESNTIKRWREKGINVYMADKVCLRFGVHPAEIFGSAFYEGCFGEESAA